MDRYYHDIVPSGYSAGFVLICASLSYALLISIYNVFFHPLAKVPGPFLAKLTKIWLFRTELTGDAANILAALHKKYGPVVRVSPNEVVIHDREAFVTMHRQGTRFYKKPAFYDAFKGAFGNLFTFIDPEDHSQRKRLMSPSFSSASLVAHQAIIYEALKPLMTTIYEKVRLQQPVPIFPIVRKFALDAICAFSYGYNSKKPTFIDEEARNKIFAALDNSPRDLLVFQHFPVLKLLVGVLAKIVPDAAPDAVLFLQRYGMERLAASRKAKDQDHPGLFYNMAQLLSAKDQQLTDEQLVAESSTLFFAGTDTTATTIAIGLWHLLHKPDIYARLHDELKTIMPEKDSQPTLKQLENLPFFDACIKEGLRIACPPRGRLPRVVPSEGFQVHDVFLPAGTFVSHPISYLLHDERVFPEPMEYRPERWLQANAKELETYLYPFSRGTRVCIGQTLSVSEQRICIAQFVRRFQPAQFEKFRPIKGCEYINYVMYDDLLMNLIEAD